MFDKKGNVTDMQSGKEKVLDKKADIVLEKLAHVYNKPGMHPGELNRHIDATLAFCKEQALAYYQSQYAPKEPHIAAHNIIEWCKDLEALASADGRLVRD